MMLATVAVLFTTNIHPRWVKLYEVPFPKNKVLANVSGGKTGAIFMLDQYNGTGQIYMYFAKTGKTLNLGRGQFESVNHDCGSGIFGIVRNRPSPNYDPNGTVIVDLYQFDDGSSRGRLTYLDGSRRVGNLILRGDLIMDMKGKVVAPSAAPANNVKAPPYMGRIIWDAKRRLALNGKKGVPDDVKDVVEILPNWKKGKNSWLSNYAFGFSRIIGNPDTGTFAIYEESNRGEACTGVFTKDLRRLISGNLIVTDIGPGGVLACRTVPNPQLGEFDGTGKAFCMDCNTGKVKWHSTSGYPGYWIGDYVLSGQSSILDGKTGRVVGKVPKHPSGLKSEYGSERDLFSALTQNNKLAVYQLKL